MEIPEYLEGAKCLMDQVLHAVRHPLRRPTRPSVHDTNPHKIFMCPQDEGILDDLLQACRQFVDEEGLAIDPLCSDFREIVVFPFKQALSPGFVLLKG